MRKPNITQNKVKTVITPENGNIIRVHRPVKSSEAIRAMSVAQIESFCGKYAQTNGCWLWYGRLTKNGYGGFSQRPFGVLPAHRVIYELTYGYRPYGEVDHLCGNKRCIRIDHLELVDHRTNTLRGNNPAAINARKTHCKRGHEFSDDNTIINKNPNKRVRRECRICTREIQRRSNARRNSSL